MIESAGTVSGSAGTTAARLFELLWGELVSVLGTAAAATLIRRAAKRACGRRPELGELRIERKGWEYHYVLPAEWNQRSAAELPAFAELVQSELVPLLRQFTGHIVLRRLARMPELKQLGFPVQEET